jgi:hypothetical protein
MHHLDTVSRLAVWSSQSAEFADGQRWRGEHTGIRSFMMRETPGLIDCRTSNNTVLPVFLNCRTTCTYYVNRSHAIYILPVFINVNAFKFIVRIKIEFSHVIEPDDVHTK